MALYAYISGDDLGLQTEVTGTALMPVDSDANGENNTLINDEQVTVTVEVDYSDAFAEFADAFYQAATTLVPINTGRLYSSISASADDWSISCYADTEYAQYVEYGTWKMMAQPYFGPALEQAWDQTAAEFDAAYQEAADELHDILVNDFEDPSEMMGHGTFAQSFFAGVFGAVFGGVFSILADMLSGGQKIGYDKAGPVFSLGSPSSYIEII